MCYCSISVQIFHLSQWRMKRAKCLVNQQQESINTLWGRSFEIILEIQYYIVYCDLMHTLRDHKLRNIRNDLPWQNNNHATKYFIFFMFKNSPLPSTAFPTGSLENRKSFSVLMHVSNAIFSFYDCSLCSLSARCDTGIRDLTAVQFYETIVRKRNCFKFSTSGITTQYIPATHSMSLTDKFTKHIYIYIYIYISLWFVTALITQLYYFTLANSRWVYWSRGDILWRYQVKVWNSPSIYDVSGSHGFPHLHRFVEFCNALWIGPWTTR